MNVLIMTIISFIVGLSISGQTFYSFVLENLDKYTVTVVPLDDYGNPSLYPEGYYPTYPVGGPPTISKERSLPCDATETISDRDAGECTGGPTPVPTPTSTAAPTATPAPTHTPTPVPNPTFSAAPLPSGPGTWTPPPVMADTSVDGGNVIDLNFGISNLSDWIQTLGGNIRIENNSFVPASTAVISGISGACNDVSSGYRASHQCV